MTVRKGYGTALLFWWFTGAFGGHRIYIQERMHYIFWYFLAAVCTLGILPIVDAFLLRKMIDDKFEADRQKEEMRKAASKTTYDEYQEERQKINDEFIQ
jgi:hypothetical protein